MRAYAFACVVVLLACSTPAIAQQAGSSTGPTASDKQFELADFTSIVSCLPFNVLITASPAGVSRASLSTSVVPEVSAALRVAVVNNTLHLGFNKSFESTLPLRVTVSMPANKLQAVENRGAGSIIINPGGALLFFCIAVCCQGSFWNSRDFRLVDSAMHGGTRIPAWGWPCVYVQVLVGLLAQHHITPAFELKRVFQG